MRSSVLSSLFPATLVLAAAIPAPARPVNFFLSNPTPKHAVMVSTGPSVSGVDPFAVQTGGRHRDRLLRTHAVRAEGR